MMYALCKLCSFPAFVGGVFCVFLYVCMVYERTCGQWEHLDACIVVHQPCQMSKKICVVVFGVEQKHFWCK